jgi:putative hydrolase of the HAD superfamily
VNDVETRTRSILGQWPRAVFVDLDETIVDGSAVVDCWVSASEYCRPTVDPQVVLNEILRLRQWFWSDPERHRVGRLDLKAAAHNIAEMAVANVGCREAGLAARIADEYSRCRDARMTLFPGAIDTLAWLRKSGCRLALLTNGGADTQRDKVARFQLAPLFDAVLIEGELGFGKPDERIYRLALDALKVAPGDTWMIGDNLEWDVGQPQTLGMKGIWIDAAGSGVPSSTDVSPDLIVKGIGELPDRLRVPQKQLR